MHILTNKKPAFVVGIDPDAEKSGWGVVNVKDRIVVRIDTISFPDLVVELKSLRDRQLSADNRDDVLVVIEGGWLNKGNWHIQHGMTVTKAAALGRRTGMNHQAGMMIAELCKAWGINYRVVPPLRKGWKGPNGKITHEEFNNFAPLPKNRTSQDARDATLLAWVYADLPIRVKSI